MHPGSATVEEDLSKAQDALDHLSVLRRSQTTLRDLVEDDHIDAGRLHATLSGNDEAIASLENFLSACINRFPTRLRTTIDSHLNAEQVLSTPELLEEILLYLSPLDLLNAIGICRATMKIFLASPKLLDQLHLRPHRGSYMSNKLSDNFPGFEVDLDDSRKNRGFASLPRTPSWPGARFNDVPVVVSFKKRSDFTIGSRCRSMLVVQPPVKSMKGNVSCCSSIIDYSDPLALMPDDHLDALGLEIADDNEDDAVPLPPDASAEQQRSSEGAEDRIEDTAAESAPETLHIERETGTGVAETIRLRCETGITVGHVLDATKKLRSAHALCAHASLSEHADDGTVRPKVRFAAVLKLKKGDPHLAQKDKDEVCRRLEGIERGDKKGPLYQPPFQPHLGVSLAATDCDLQVLGIMRIYIDSKRRCTSSMPHF